jgi:heme oxygenase
MSVKSAKKKPREIGTKKTQRKTRDKLKDTDERIPFHQLDAVSMRQFFIEHAARVRPVMEKLTPGFRPSPWDKKKK